VSITELFAFKLTIDKASAQTLIFDDIEFITADVLPDGLAIGADGGTIYSIDPFDLATSLPKEKVLFAYKFANNTPAATLVNQDLGPVGNSFTWNTWFDDPITYDVTGDASIAGSMVTPNGLGVSFSVFANVGALTSNARVYTVVDSVKVPLDTFQDKALSGNNGVFTYPFDPGQDGTGFDCNSVFVSMDRSLAGFLALGIDGNVWKNIASTDISECTDLTLMVQRSGDNHPDTITIGLTNDRTTYYEVTFSLVGNGVNDIRIPISDFTSQGLDDAAVTGLNFTISKGGFVVCNVIAE
jgi:hypothetical protein